MPPVPHTPATEAQDHAALIVALDAGDLAGAELRAAESLAASCTGCAALVHDLAAIRGAMTALPVPVRRRDYRLTAEDAARLHPSGWRRVLDWLAAPGSTVRPLATGLATLGVMGLLLTSGLPGMLGAFGSAGAAPALAPAGSPLGAGDGGTGGTVYQGTGGPEAVPSSAPARDPGLAATGGPAPADTAAPAASAAPALASTAAPSDKGAGLAGQAASAEPTGERTSAGTPNGAPDQGKSLGLEAASPLPLPALVSLALLALGLALLVGRMLARRRLS